MFWVLVGICLVVAGLAFYREPRRLLIGHCLLAAILLILGWALLQAIAALAPLGVNATAYALLALILVGTILTGLLGVMLVLNGAALVRKEGRSPAHLLTALAGVGVLGYLALVVFAVTGNRVNLVLWLGLALIPIAGFGFGFVSFLLYSTLYQRWTRHHGRPQPTVVVLGAGLINGQVPPLLAARLDTGRRLYQESVAAGIDAVIVVSGGQGEDEPVAEAVAMAEYLTDAGVSSAKVLLESESRNTEENLVNTADLLRADQREGGIAVVTNSFHAFRAALLMRKAGLDGYSVGAPTAAYYWPAAMIREYLAILRDHLWLTITMAALSSAPLLVAALIAGLQLLVDAR